MSKPTGVGSLESDLFKMEATVNTEEQRWENIQRTECED